MDVRTRVIRVSTPTLDRERMVVVCREHSVRDFYFAHENWVSPDFWAKVDAIRRGQLNKGR